MHRSLQHLTFAILLVLAFLVVPASADPVIETSPDIREKVKLAIEPKNTVEAPSAEKGGE